MTTTTIHRLTNCGKALTRVFRDTGATLVRPASSSGGGEWEMTDAQYAHALFAVIRLKDARVDLAWDAVCDDLEERSTTSL